MSSNIAVIGCSSHPEFAKTVAQRFTQLTDVITGTFSDGEIRFELNDTVRGKDVYIVQSLCAPVNDHVMELLIAADAVRRAGADRITAVVPYMGYARQDRRANDSRSPITARLLAKLIETSGINQLITFDLHSPQSEGFFDIPIVNIPTPRIQASIVDELIVSGKLATTPVLVSPDSGGVGRTQAVARKVTQAGPIEMAIIDKRRSKPNEASVFNIIGDVEGKTCIIVDDMVDTAGTLCKAAEALIEQGAKQVMALCTHGVLSGNALEKLNNSVIEKLVITDTIPQKISTHDGEAIEAWQKIIEMRPVTANYAQDVILQIRSGASTHAVYE